MNGATAMPLPNACGECGAPGTAAVIDSVQAHLVCTECGCVYKRCFVAPQRSTFMAKERASGMVSRGAHTNLTTFIASSSSAALPNMTTLQRTHQSATQPHIERRRHKIWDAIDELAVRMGLHTRLVDVAKLITIEIHANYHKKTKKDELLAVVCVALACRRLSLPRSFQDLAGHCSNVTRKELGRAFKTFSRAIGTKTGHFHIEKMVPKFATSLGFRGADVLLCEHIAKTVHRHGLVPGRNPLSSIAAALYLAAQCMGERYQSMDAGTIAGHLSIAENTVRKAYRDLYQHTDRILTRVIRLKYRIDPLWMPDLRSRR